MELTHMHKKLIVLLALTLLSACNDSSIEEAQPIPPPPPPPEPTYELNAEIRRTEYGIPHITANDWKSLGYGFGYAYAQDNYCVTMREIVFASGRSAELMGESMGNLGSDFLFRYLNGDKAEFEQKFVSQLPEFTRELAEGYARGMNRYLNETGVENLPEGDYGCRNAEWVSEIDTTDLFLYLRREALRGSSDNGTFRSALLAVEGPPDDGATGLLPNGDLSALARDVSASLGDIRSMEEGQ